MKNSIHAGFTYQVKSKGNRMPNQKPKRIRRKSKTITNNSAYIFLMKLILTLLNICATYLIYRGMRDGNTLYFISGILISIPNGLVMAQLDKNNS